MAFIFTYECPPTNGVRIDCITYSQLIFMPKKEKRVQSSSLQQSFSIRNDKLFDLSLSVRLQRTGLLKVTFDCRDCKPSLREFSQSYFFPHSGTGRIPCSQRVTGAERFLWPSHNPVFFKSVALKSTKSSRNDSNYENTFQKPGMSLLNKRASLYARTLEFVLPFYYFSLHSFSGPGGLPWTINELIKGVRELLNSLFSCVLPVFSEVLPGSPCEKGWPGVWSSSELWTILSWRLGWKWRNFYTSMI